MNEEEKQIKHLSTLKPSCESKSDSHHIKGYVDDEGVPYITMTALGDPSETTLLIMQHSANSTMQAMLRVFTLLRSVTNGGVQ